MAFLIQKLEKLCFVSHDSNRRSNRDFFNVQPTELIVNTIEYKFVRRLCFGFLIPNGHTSVVGFNTNSIVLHNQSSRKCAKSSTPTTNPLESLLVGSARVRHFHRLTVAGIVCNSDVRVTFVLITRLLNPHLVDFTFLPIRVVGVDFGDDVSVHLGFSGCSHTTRTLWTIQVT